MKVNFYNHYVRQENGVICYNALTDAYLLLKDPAFSNFEINCNNLQEFQSNYPAQYNVLCRNGFIVDDDFDEKEFYKNLYYERKYSRNAYFIIINPTLNCNLGCWYCYENHPEKSELTVELIDRILLHIKQKQELDQFKNLGLSFFGGEPMLKSGIIVELLNRVDNLAKEKDFNLSVSFTTNGTILPKTLLDLLKNFNVSFQITLDGNKETHDTVRVFKSENKQGSYDLILKNIRRITDELTDCRFIVRVNFTNNTLNGLTRIVDDLEFCDRKRTTINLQRVWQADHSEIDKSVLFEFINYAKAHNFIVRYMDIYPQLSVCYADNYNETVINYNGDVFKCTARDFSTVEPEGKLLKDGSILWNTEKWLRRIGLRLPAICENCNLLPACGSFCSQTRLEQGENVKCKLDSDFTKNDYIIHNLNRQLLTNKINAL